MLKKHNIPAVLFFLIFLITGMAVVRDYGVHLDEFNSHDFGARWYQYVNGVLIHKAPLIPMKAESSHDVIHGPAFEITVAFLADKVFHLSDSREIIFFRHYCVWFLFYISVVVFYFLIRQHFAHKIYALLGCLLLVLHPRIFANSFYNSVDMAFLSFYILCLFTLTKYQHTKSPAMAVCHALTCGILIDIRLIGVVMPCISYLFFLENLSEILKDQNKRALPEIRNALVYTLMLALFMVAFWPYLWRDPLSGIAEIIRITPRIAFGETVLYLGQYIKAMELPWHYLPVWIAITTPILYSFFFITGCLANLPLLLKNHRFYTLQTGSCLLFILAFFLPLFLVIIFHSTLYDSWRHMFFLYPAFVLLALTGIKCTHFLIEKYFHGARRLIFRTILVSGILISLISTGASMIQNHPYQYVYFNLLAGRSMQDIKNKFDMDYWGLSCRTALEYLAAHDQSANIVIYDELLLGPLINNLKILPISDRIRFIRVLTPDNAQYSLTIYRWPRPSLPAKEYFSVQVGNAKITSIFKLKDEKAKLLLF